MRNVFLNLILGLVIGSYWEVQASSQISDSKSGLAKKSILPGFIAKLFSKKTLSNNAKFAQKAAEAREKDLAKLQQEHESKVSIKARDLINTRIYAQQDFALDYLFSEQNVALLNTVAHPEAAQESEVSPAYSMAAQLKALIAHWQKQRYYKDNQDSKTMLHLFRKLQAWLFLTFAKEEERFNDDVDIVAKFIRSSAESMELTKATMDDYPESAPRQRLWDSEENLVFVKSTSTDFHEPVRVALQNTLNLLADELPTTLNKWEVEVRNREKTLPNGSLRVILQTGILLPNRLTSNNLIIEGRANQVNITSSLRKELFYSLTLQYLFGGAIPLLTRNGELGKLVAEIRSILKKQSAALQRYDSPQAAERPFVPLDGTTGAMVVRNKDVDLD